MTSQAALRTVEIVEAYERAVGATVEGCRKLAQAKAAIPHGKWIEFCGSLGLTRFRAAKLLRIGRCQWLGAKENHRYLPIDDEILSVLAQSNTYVLSQALESGRIKPDMTRRAAERIRDGAI